MWVRIYFSFLMTCNLILAEGLILGFFNLVINQSSQMVIFNCTNGEQIQKDKDCLIVYDCTNYIDKKLEVNTWILEFDQFGELIYERQEGLFKNNQSFQGIIFQIEEYQFSVKSYQTSINNDYSSNSLDTKKKRFHLFKGRSLACIPSFQRKQIRLLPGQGNAWGKTPTSPTTSPTSTPTSLSTIPASSTINWTSDTANGTLPTAQNTSNTPNTTVITQNPPIASSSPGNTSQNTDSNTPNSTSITQLNSSNSLIINQTTNSTANTNINQVTKNVSNLSYSSSQSNSSNYTHSSQNFVQSQTIRQYGTITLQLKITLSGDITQDQIKSYLDTIQTVISPDNIQTKANITSSIESNIIIYNINVTGSISYAKIIVKDKNALLQQVILTMVSQNPIKSSTTKQQASISDALQRNKSVASQIFNYVRFTAILSLLANNPQFIAHYLLIDVVVPEQVWENQRMLTIFIWKTIPSYDNRFNGGTIQLYKLYGVDVDKEVIQNQSNLIPFHVLMISNYFLVNFQLQLFLLLFVLLITLIIHNKKRAQKTNELNILYSTPELQSYFSLQLICQVLEPLTLIILISSLFQIMHHPFQTGVSILSIISFIMGLMTLVIYFFVLTHQLIVSQKVYKYIGLVSRCDKSLSVEFIQYLREKYAYDHSNTKIDSSKLTFFYRYIIMVKKILFAFTTIFLFGYPLIQLIILQILHISSIVLTMIVRPYLLIHDEIFHSLSNILLSIALGIRISLQQQINEIQNSQQNNQDEESFERWDYKGWIIVYCELIAVIIEAILTITGIILILYKKYLNRKISVKDQNDFIIQSDQNNIEDKVIDPQDQSNSINSSTDLENNNAMLEIYVEKDPIYNFFLDDLDKQKQVYMTEATYFY